MQGKSREKILVLQTTCFIWEVGCVGEGERRAKVFGRHETREL